MGRIWPGLDEAAILDLNGAYEAETSKLDLHSLRSLLTQAAHVGVRGTGGRDGFLIALDESAAYDNQNFRWFLERYRRFLYVDRIVVAAACQHRGMARELYAELCQIAVQAGHEIVGCEINTVPPNPRSMSFHARLGFVEVDRAVLADRGKAVSYMTKRL